MASRIMHLCISKELEKIIQIENVNNFRIGHILPDAVISADKKQVNTHFIKDFEEKGKYYKIFDYYGFYDRFREFLPNDEIFLGYYFHLIEDNVFRKVLYTDLRMLNRRGDSVFLKELYSDYEILNHILIEKFHLKNDLDSPKLFTDCKINNIYNFELTVFMKDMEKDFHSTLESIQGKSKIFTKSITEGYIKQCVNICGAEYESILQGKHFLSEKELAFEINGRS